MQHSNPSINGCRAEARIVLAACAAGSLLLLGACGKQQPHGESIVAKPAPAVSDAKVDDLVLDALTPAQPAVSRQDDSEIIVERADEILDQHARKTAVELLNLPEVNQALRSALDKLSKDKKLQEHINSSVVLAAQMQGLSAAPGTVGLDLDTSGYDASRKRRMLQAVLTGDPKPIVTFLTEEIGEAAPELSYGRVERAANGVAIKQTPPPAAK